MSKSTYRIKIKDGYFIDEIRESPVDHYQVRFRRKLLLLFLFVIGAALCLAWYFYRVPDSPGETTAAIMICH
jgi:hypothetical protein